MGGVPVGADMATYDPSTADLMGSDAPTSDASLLAAESAEPPGSVEVSLTFTNPMMAAPTGHGGLPEGPLPPTTTAESAGAAPARAGAMMSPMHAEAASAAEPTHRRAGAPGPLSPTQRVAQVTAKPSALRVVVPLALALCVLAAAVVFVLRTRAANARVGASTGLVSTSSPLVEDPAAAASGGAPSSGAPEVEPRAPIAAGEATASAPPPATSAASASAEAKKPKARGKHHAKPAAAAAKSADEAPSTPVVTSTEPATSPAEDPSKAPKEAQPAPTPMATSMPQAVPAPAPQPLPQPVPTPVEAP
jgi:hypothetical protein